MTVGKRLLALAFAALVAFAIVGGVALHQLDRMATSMRFVSEVAINGLVYAAEMNNQYKREQITTSRMAADPDDSRRGQLAGSITVARQKLQAALNAYEAALRDDEDRAIYQTLKAKLDRFASQYDMVREKLEAKDLQGAAYILNGNGLTAAIGVEQQMNVLMEYKVKAARAEAERVVDIERQSRIVLGATLAAALLALMAAGALIARSIRNPLAQVQAAMTRIAGSLDLTQRVKTSGRRDEIELTARAFNTLLDALHQSVKDMADKIGQVSGAAEDVSKTAGELSQTAAGASESASEMAATVEQVTVSIGHVADRATEADSLSRSAGEEAASGAGVIERTVGQIDRIAEDVREAAAMLGRLQGETASIGVVVKAIKEVAEQTNLLALNAAIEAARAGEQGRGFSVVADEVRKLAERTAASTQEIAEIIRTVQDGTNQTVSQMENTVRHVEESVASAREAGAAILRIREGSGEVGVRVADISSAISEQGEASHTMARSVEQVARMSEENSAAAAKAAQSSAFLRELSQQMQAAVGRYQY